VPVDYPGPERLVAGIKVHGIHVFLPRDAAKSNRCFVRGEERLGECVAPVNGKAGTCNLDPSGVC
jgi:hypothetical protein